MAYNSTCNSFIRGEKLLDYKSVQKLRLDAFIFKNMSEIRALFSEKKYFF